MSEGTDWTFFDRPATQVESQMSFMSGRADEAINVAYDVIAKLGDIKFEQEPPAPKAELEPVEIVPPVGVEKPNGGLSFGEVHQPGEPSEFDAWGKLGVSEQDFGMDIDPFDPKSPTMKTINDPEPLDASGKPERGDFGDVVIPDRVEVLDPLMGDMVDISVPEFDFPEIAPFSDEAPTFEEARPNTNLVWSEPEYASELLDDTTSRVRAWLQGGTGLPAAVQQALFDKARSREVDTAKEATEAAFDTWAARGFSMPPGMLVEQVNVAQEKSRLAQNTLEREILIKSAEWEIENLRVAVERGIALETVLINKFSNSAQRIFEAAKYRVEADVSLFNAMVSLFNAKSSAYQVAATVFKVNVEAQLAKLEAYKAQIEGEKAKGQLNEQTVRVYEAKLKAIASRVDIYKAQMEGAKIESDVIRGKIEAYRSDVEAYAAKVGAEKTRFEAYEAQLKGEAAKANSLEAEANAYAATVRANEAKANLKVKYVEAKISAMGADVSNANSKIELEKARVSASAEAISSKARVYAADVSRYSEEIKASGMASESATKILEMRLRNNLAYFDAAIKEYDAKMGRLLEQSKLVVEGLRSAGQYTAALAQGAMSAIHLNASMSASGAASSSSSYQNSFQEIHNYKHGG